VKTIDKTADVKAHIVYMTGKEKNLAKMNPLALLTIDSFSSLDSTTFFSSNIATL